MRPNRESLITDLRAELEAWRAAEWRQFNDGDEWRLAWVRGEARDALAALRLLVPAPPRWDPPTKRR